VSLGQRIRSAREAADLSREELAEMVGVSVKTIGNWERDAVAPKSKLGAVERALGVQLREGNDRQAIYLEDASDAQVIADLASRLAARDARIRECEAEIKSLRAQLEGRSPRSMPNQWAARARERDEEGG
jgi:transcriptional regulator with XRE-family HTH domain